MTNARLDLLLAESDDPDREFRAEALRAFTGVRVTEVRNGRDAVTSLTRGSFHAFVCAGDLDDVHALKLTRLIRDGACGHPGLPVIVISPDPKLHALSAVGPGTYFLSDSTPLQFAREALRLFRSDSKKTVLLVEDDPAHSESTAEMLGRHYRVEQAHTGPAALDAWRKRRHDVVLLDLMLPGMSGEHVQQQILMEAGDQIIIVLAANSDPEMHPSMVLAGASAFLKKPLEVLAITRTIEAILRDRECNALASAACGFQERLNSLAARVRAADYWLSRGRASAAARHLQSALTQGVVRDLSDDQWAKLLSE